VITGSNQTKTDLIKYFGLNADKVVVTPYGVDPCFRPITDKQRFVEVKTKYGIDNEFILYVGNLQPRKNLVRLFLAFERLKIKRKINEKLVIVGKKAWLYQDIFKTYEQLKAKEEIIFTGYVPTEEIPVLYSAARIFVYPSLYEGFGLPPLEAMACGVPVLTSLVSSLPEVVGDSALLVDPYSVEEIANGIERLLSDEKLRLSLREKGLRKASTFSWRRTAELTLAVYRDALREVKSEYVS
jgi:glycosyltransferase involved in cell wall biosynthesis